MQHIAHPASVDAYIRHGWSLVPIPPGTKGPATKGWNRKENALVSQASLPQGHGIGLAHAYSGTMALDIDDWDRAAFELMLKGINLQALYDAPDAVIVDSGRAGRGKLLYAMPFGLALPSKKLTADTIMYLELRCGTTNGLTSQDVIPPSRHPLTNQPYRWAGKGHWSRLPQIPAPLLDLWMSLIHVEENVKNEHDIADMSIRCTWDEASEMLSHINPDVSRKQWVDCGMALHLLETQTGEQGRGFQLWNEWSARGAKYKGVGEIQTQWRSFRSDKGSLVTVGTLKHIALEHGWRPALPDLTELFKAVPPPASPQDILNKLTPPAPSCDVSVFPAVLQRRAQEVSTGIGCDPMVPLFAGLAAVCGAVDGRTRLKLAEGWEVPPVLWLMTIGEPAGKKTPGSAPMFKILGDIEKEDAPAYEKRHLEWEGQEVAHSTAMKSFRDYCASPDYLLNPGGAPFVPTLPPEPQKLRIAITDITSQDMIRKAAVRPQGMLMYRDELASWFNQLVDPKSGVDRSAWTVAFEARSYHMDRVGSGHIYAENLAVSIYGNIQPDALGKHLYKLTEDGFMQRFIPGVLPRARWKRGNPLPDFLTNREQWENTIRMVHALPTMEYSLSDAAAQEFYDFQTWFGQRQDDAQLLELSSAYRTALGKCDGTLGRLALVFHVMESPFSQQVSGDTMRRAAECMREFIVPSLYFTLNQINGGSDFERKVFDYVIQHSSKGELTLQELTRWARRQKDLDGVNDWKLNQNLITIMYTVEQAGWAVRTDTGVYEYKGTATWAIQPLHVQFPEHRKSVIDAKQRLQDQIWSKSGREAPRVYGAG